MIPVISECVDVKNGCLCICSYKHTADVTVSHVWDEGGSTAEEKREEKKLPFHLFSNIHGLITPTSPGHNNILLTHIHSNTLYLYCSMELQWYHNGALLHCNWPFWHYDIMTCHRIMKLGAGIFMNVIKNAVAFLWQIQNLCEKGLLANITKSHFLFKIR